jgi:hypothetical protein
MVSRTSKMYVWHARILKNYNNKKKHNMILLPIISEIL